MLGVPHGWPYPRPGATAGCAEAPGRRSPPLRSASPASSTTGTSTSMGRCACRRWWTPATCPATRPTARATRDARRRGRDRDPRSRCRADLHRRRRLRPDPDPASLRGPRPDHRPPGRRAPRLPRRGAGRPRGLLVADAPRVGDGARRADRPGRPAGRRLRARRRRGGARAAGNLLVTARELRERGVPWLLEQLPRGRIGLRGFDCDGLDPSVLPAVSAPAPGGLSYVEAATCWPASARGWRARPSPSTPRRRPT